MTTKEKIDQAVAQLDEKKQQLLLNIIELQSKGIKVFMILNGRPVLDEAEMSKLDMLPYFQDDFSKES